MTDRELTDEEIYAAFAQMIRKQDYWRGYFGDEVSDEEILDWLGRAIAALAQEASLSD